MVAALTASHALSLQPHFHDPAGPEPVEGVHLHVETTGEATSYEAVVVSIIRPEASAGTWSRSTSQVTDLRGMNVLTGGIFCLADG
jgi:hypothetical protein